MSALSLIEAVQRAGGAIRLQGDRLRLSAPKPLPEDLLQELRTHKPEVIDHLQHARPSELRASAAEPLEGHAAPPLEMIAAWSEGVARLRAMPPPPNYPQHAWQQLILDAGRFLDDWAAQAAALGWPDWALFGCCRHAPWGRIQGLSLVQLLHGRGTGGADRSGSGDPHPNRRTADLSPQAARPARSRRAVPHLGTLVMAAVPALARTTFRTSRLLEFCSRKELVA
jgi:hypothetical protein